MVFKVFRCESPSELRRDAADSLGMGITSSWLMMVSNNEAPRQSQYKMKGDKIMDNILKSNYDQSLYSFIFFLCPDLIQSKNKYKWWWHQRINTPNFLDFWSSFWTFDHLFFLSQCSEALNARSVSVSVVGFLHLSVQCFVMWVSVPISGWPWSRFCLLMAFWWYLQSRSCSLGKSDASLASYWVLSSVKPKYL